MEEDSKNAAALEPRRKLVDPNAAECRPIVVLDNHSGAVSVVKFSSCGRFMASGGDDRVVMIWSPFDSNDMSSWRCVGQLHGHASDIQDLDWERRIQAGQSKPRIASCSVDNSVIVWNIEKLAAETKISGHHGWVKGVAWDPLGEFLASQCADGMLRVWRTSDWGLEKEIQPGIITQALATNGQSALNRQIVFNRIDWSPDGQLLASCYGNENGVFTSPVYKRGGEWQRTVKFIGHEQPTTISRFNPKVFRKQKPEEGMKKKAEELSSSVEPKQDERDLKMKPAWKRGDISLFCAIGSIDAGISVWGMDRRPRVVFQNLFQQTVLDIAWAKDGLTCIASSHDGSVAMMRFSASDLSASPLTDLEQENYIRSYLGEKAITSLNQESMVDISIEDFFEEQPEDVEMTSENNLLNVPSKPAPSNLASSTPQEEAVESIRNSTENVVSQQVVEKTATGKRRIRPMVVEPANSSFMEPSSSLSHDTGARFDLASENLRKQRKLVEFQVPKSLKRELFKDLLPLSASKKEFTVSIEHRDRDLGEGPLSPFTSFMPLGPLESSVPFQLSISIENRVSIQGGVLEKRSIVSLTRGSDTLWTQEIPGQVSVACGNSSFVAVACIDCSLYVLSVSGRFLLPPIVLSAAPALLSSHAESESAQSLLLAITCDGEFRVWDIDKKELSQKCSIRPLLGMTSPSSGSKKEEPLPTLCSAFLNEKGIPMCGLTDGTLYSFDRNMDSWFRVFDRKYVGSEFHSLFRSKDDSIRRASLDTITQPIRESDIAAELLHLKKSQQVLRTIAHLENEIAASLALKSGFSYRTWLRTYVDCNFHSSHHLFHSKV